MTSFDGQPNKLKVVDLNPYLSCILCGGYFIDATTITECLHSFCRACIVRYLETSKYCPVCEVQIHKTRPLRCIRSDKILQNIVYKLVPGLFQNEMKMRRELYASQPPEALKCSKNPEDRGEITEDCLIYAPDEIFDLILQYSGVNEKAEGVKDEEGAEPPDKDWLRRFLRCPAALKMFHIKKFIRFKYNIPEKFMIVLEYSCNLLRDDYSLMDVAYIFAWKRNGPLKFIFRVVEWPKEQFSLSTETHAESSTDSTVESKSPVELDELEEVALKDKSEVVLKDKSKVLTSDTNVHCEGQGCNNNVSISSESTEEESNSKSLITEIEDCIPVIIEPETIEICDETLSLNDSSVTETISEKKNQESTQEDQIPPKVPKLTIPLTPKILEQAAQHAIDDKVDSDSDLFEGRLVIAEPELSPKEQENDDDKMIKDHTDDVDEIDSGRGSDGSSRAEARSICGDDDISSLGSSSVYSPVFEKLNPFPMQLSCPKTGNGIHVSPIATKDDVGALDLSVCHRKRSHDRFLQPRSMPVANPPILDKHRQVTPCLDIPKYPSFKLLPQSNLYKKPDCPRGYFRYNRGSTLTVFNPDPNSDRPKIVIKNMDPRPAHRHHHHHHNKMG